MKRKYFYLIASGVFIAVFFQNCSKNSLALSDQFMSKMNPGDAAPLVEDVVIDAGKGHDGENHGDDDHHSGGSQQSGNHDDGHKDGNHQSQGQREGSHDQSSSRSKGCDSKGEQKESKSGNLGESLIEVYACGNSKGNQRGNSGKVLVCHYPAGKKELRRTLCISKSALQAHLDHREHEDDHKDHLGACEESEQQI